MNSRAEKEEAREREVDGIKPVVGQRQRMMSMPTLGRRLTGANSNTVDLRSVLALDCEQPYRSGE